jgi:hypothetical protein
MLFFQSLIKFNLSQTRITHNSIYNHTKFALHNIEAIDKQINYLLIISGKILPFQLKGKNRRQAGGPGYLPACCLLSRRGRREPRGMAVRSQRERDVTATLKSRHP